MALPRTLPAAFIYPAQPSNLGPLANGAVYIVGLSHPATNTHLEVWKSSDPDSTAFAVQDASNNPVLDSAAVDPACSVAAWLDGSIIHIAVAAATHTNDLTYWRYDTSADTWSTGHGAWGTVLAAFGGDGDPTYLATDIRVHTVGAEEWIEIAYNGGQSKVHGTNWDRAVLATYDPGVGWTVDQVWDNSGTTDQSSYFILGLAVGAAGHVHGLVINGTGTSTVGVSTADASGNAAQAWEDTVGSIAGTTTPFGTGLADGNAISFRRAGQPGGTANHTNFEFTSADPVTTLVENGVIDNVLVADPYLNGIAADGSDIYTFYAENVSGDIYYDLNDDTDVAEFTLSLAGGGDLSVGPSSYTVGGRNVIGIIYDDGTAEYDELSLAAPADEFPVVPHEALQLSAIPQVVF